MLTRSWRSAGYLLIDAHSPKCVDPSIPIHEIILNNTRNDSTQDKCSFAEYRCFRKLFPQVFTSKFENDEIDHTNSGEPFDLAHVLKNRELAKRQSAASEFHARSDQSSQLRSFKGTVDAAVAGLFIRRTTVSF